MKYCSHCGKEVMDTAAICPHCGGALGSADMQIVTDRSRTYSLVLAALLLVSGFFTLYTNFTPLLSSWSFYEQHPMRLVLRLISLCMAAAAICLAGMTLLGKGTANEKTSRPVWLFYIIGNVVYHTMEAVNYAVAFDTDFVETIGYAYGEEAAQGWKYSQLILPVCSDICLLIVFAMILLAVKRKAGLESRQKTVWLVGSIALLLSIIARIFIGVNLNSMGIMFEDASVITRSHLIGLVFAIALDAALFIKLSLETVWADMVLPEQTSSPVKEVKEEEPKMKYCSHCGKEIMDAAVVCPHCGCPVNGGQAVDDTPSTGLDIVSFLLPVVGLILYLVYHDKAPQKAAAIGKWALIGLAAGIVLSGVYYGIVLSAFL